MAASAHARNVSLALGSRHMLVEVDLSLDPGHRIGLIGPNGVGKSTLLRVLAGGQHPDAGAVSLSPPSATVGYLDQEPERTAETVLDYLARRTGSTNSVTISRSTPAVTTHTCTSARSLDSMHGRHGTSTTPSARLSSSNLASPGTCG